MAKLGQVCQVYDCLSLIVVVYMFVYGSLQYFQVIDCSSWLSIFLAFMFSQVLTKCMDCVQLKITEEVQFCSFKNTGT